jgi:hypothetical protein
MNRRRYTNGLEGKQVIVRLGLLAMNRRRYTNGLEGKQVIVRLGLLAMNRRRSPMVWRGSRLRSCFAAGSMPAE